MAKCAKMSECVFYEKAAHDEFDPLKYVWRDFCHLSPSRCVRLRRDRLASVSDSQNRVSPLGFDPGAIMKASMRIHGVLKDIDKDLKAD